MNLSNNNINSIEYWDGLFESGSWKDNGGESQTRQFALAQAKCFRISSHFSGSILDFGCGLGDAFTVYRNEFPKARLIGVDFSSSAIKICKKKYGDIAEFICGDEKSVPEADVIIASNILEHLDNDLEVARHLLSRCVEIYITVPYREQFLIEEHVNVYDTNAFDLLGPVEKHVFACRGWSQYGIKGLWWQFYIKNILRPFFGKTLLRRRKQIMFRVVNPAKSKSALKPEYY